MMTKQLLIYRELNDKIVDDYPHMYDYNLYDIEGYTNELYDDIKFTIDQCKHLEKRVIALRKFIEANEELNKYETIYA